MRLHYQGSSRKNFAEFIRYNNKKGYLEDSFLVHVNPRLLQEVIDMNHKRKHIRCKKHQLSKKRRKELIQLYLTRMFVDMCIEMLDGTYESDEERNSRVSKEIHLE